MYNTAGDRDIGGTHLYKVKPTSNCFCCEYEIDVRKVGGDIMETKRHGLWCCPVYKSAYNSQELGE